MYVNREAVQYFQRTLKLLENLEADGFCSSDGSMWYSVGRTEFSVDDPIEVGMVAIGNIDRTIYPGAYPGGTAIRLESFELRHR